MSDESEAGALSNVDAAAAKRAYGDIVSAVREALAGAPSLRRAFNAVANLGASADRMESSLREGEGVVEAQPTPYFALVAEAEKLRDAERRTAADLAAGLATASAARSDAERRANKALQRSDALESQLRVLGVTAEADAADATQLEAARRADDEQKTRENVALRSNLGELQRSFARLHKEVQRLRLVKGSSVVSRARFAALEAMRRRQESAVRDAAFAQLRGFAEPAGSATGAGGTKDGGGDSGPGVSADAAAGGGPAAGGGSAAAHPPGSASAGGAASAAAAAAGGLASRRAGHPGALIAPADLMLLHHEVAAEEAAAAVNPSARGSRVAARLLEPEERDELMEAGLPPGEADARRPLPLPASSDRWWAGGEFSAAWRGGDASASLLMDLYAAFHGRLHEFLDPPRDEEAHRARIEAAAAAADPGARRAVILRGATGTASAEAASARMLGPGPGGRRDDPDSKDGAQGGGRAGAGGASVRSLPSPAAGIPERVSLQLLSLQLHASPARSRADVALELWETMQEAKAMEGHIRAAMAREQRRLAGAVLRRYRRRFGKDPPPRSGADDGDEGGGGRPRVALRPPPRLTAAASERWTVEDVLDSLDGAGGRAHAPQPTHGADDGGQDAPAPPLEDCLTPHELSLLRVGIGAADPFAIITGRHRLEPPLWLEPVLRRHRLPLTFPPGGELSTALALRIVYSALLDKLRQETAEAEAAARVGRVLGASTGAFSEHVALVRAAAAAEAGISDPLGAGGLAAPQDGSAARQGDAGGGSHGRRAAVAVSACEWLVLYLVRVTGSAEAASATAVAVADSLEQASEASDHASLVLETLSGTRGECAVRYLLRCQLALVASGVNLDAQAPAPASHLASSPGGRASAAVMASIAAGGSDGGPRPSDMGAVASALYPPPHTPPVRRWCAALAAYVRRQQARTMASRGSVGERSGGDGGLGDVEAAEEEAEGGRFRPGMEDEDAGALDSAASAADAMAEAADEQLAADVALRSSTTVASAGGSAGPSGDGEDNDADAALAREAEEHRTALNRSLARARAAASGVAGPEGQEAEAAVLATVTHETLVGFLAWQIRRGGAAEPRLARYMRQILQLGQGGAMDQGVRMQEALRIAGALLRRTGTGVALTPLLRGEAVCAAAERWVAKAAPERRGRASPSGSGAAVPVPVGAASGLREAERGGDGEGVRGAGGARDAASPRINTGHGSAREMSGRPGALAAPPGRDGPRAPVFTSSALDLTPLPIASAALAIAYVDIAAAFGDAIVGKSGSG